MRNPVYAICEQQRRRSACASAQSNQRLCCSLPRYYLISIFAVSWLSLASVAGQAGLSLALSKAPKTGFLLTRLIYYKPLLSWSPIKQAVKMTYAPSEDLDQVGHPPCRYAKVTVTLNMISYFDLIPIGINVSDVIERNQDLYCALTTHYCANIRHYFVCLNYTWASVFNCFELKTLVKIFCK